jgi:uncharacterized membrane protein
MTKKIAYSGVFGALIMAFTLLSIPIHPFGYVHIGDSLIFLCCFILPLPFCAIAAGVGSMFADIILSYTIYAPATLVIKALMAIVARLFVTKTDKIGIAMIGFLLASLLMQVGYWLYNIMLGGEAYGLIGWLTNLTQTAASIPVAFILVKFVPKVRQINDTRLLWRKKV